MATAMKLGDMRPCLEGVLPAIVATCDAAGEPNITYLSKVFYIDADHVALSNQFFTKTVANVRQNPRAEVTLLEPGTVRHYRFELEYEHSLSSGERFERASAEIDAVASLMGKEDVFHLRALDVYRVLSIYRVPSDLDEVGD
jgi:adenylate cyclase